MNLLLLALLVSPVFAANRTTPTPRPAPRVPGIMTPVRLFMANGARLVGIAQDHILVGFPDAKALEAARAAGKTPETVEGVPVKYLVTGGARTLAEARQAAVAQVRQAFAAADSLDESAASGVFDGTAPMLKPAVEGWSVEGKGYDSTANLAAALRGLDKPVDATYLFSHEAVPAPKARLEETVRGAVTGGVAGLVGAMIISFLAAVLGPVNECVLFVGAITGGSVLDDLALLGGVLGGAGAYVGALIGWEEAGKPLDLRSRIRGRLFRQAGENGGTLYFETTAGDKTLTVDLGKYAEAAPVPGPAPLKAWPGWKRAGAGALAGFSLAVSQWIPIVQAVALFIAGPYAGVVIGQALAHGKGAAGGVIGGMLGLLVPVLAFASFAAANGPTGILLAFASFAGLLTVIGTVIGLLAADKVRAQWAREDARAPAGQWWVRARSRGLSEGP